MSVKTEIDPKYNAEQTELISSVQVLKEIEELYREAGVKSQEFYALDDYTDYRDKIRQYEQSDYRDPIQRGHVLFMIGHIERSRGVNAYGEKGEKIEEAFYCANQLSYAYTTEGYSKPEAEDKVTDQFLRIRNQLLNDAFLNRNG